MKKNLTWKLKEMPTGGELADLVETGVISKEEAREIMFGSAENDKEKVKALEEQLEFLRDLVKELSKNRTTTIYDWTYAKPIKYYNSPYWKTTDTILCNAGLDLKTEQLGTLTTTGYSSVKGGDSSTPVMTMSVSTIADKTIS
jgi:hypothetical protein